MLQPASGCHLGAKGPPGQGRKGGMRGPGLNGHCAWWTMGTHRLTRSWTSRTRQYQSDDVGVTIRAEFIQGSETSRIPGAEYRRIELSSFLTTLLPFPPLLLFPQRSGTCSGRNET